MSTAPASVDGEAGAVVYFPWQPAQEKEGTAVDINALNGPKMTEGQIQTYLARLGIREEVPRTLEGLARIQLAHKIAGPFENLDIVAGRPLSLDLNHLYDKIVVRRQGGVCAELNTLYNWLLYSLGFRVVSYNARMLSPDTYLFRRHRILVVELEGKTYTTDVGFATENARGPLELTEGNGSERRPLRVPLPVGALLRFGPSPSAGRGVTGSGSRPLPWNPRLTGTLTRCFSSLKRARSPT